MKEGFLLNDPDLGIDWGMDDLKPTISEKDLKHPGFREAEKNF